MPKPSEIITTVAALMNDPEQAVYTNAACLSYLNLSLNILQETFELNNIPVTNETSVPITVPANITKVGFDTVPALPTNLVEIQQLFESDEGLERWIPVEKRDFLPKFDTIPISYFRVWAWMGEAINLLPSNNIRDLKIDYVASVFKTPILLANVNVNIEMKNIQTFLEFETAALCALFVAENETRALALGSEAGSALSRSLGIPIKGTQSIITRRRPFRAGFKRRGHSY